MTRGRYRMRMTSHDGVTSEIVQQLIVRLQGDMFKCSTLGVVLAHSSLQHRQQTRTTLLCIRKTIISDLQPAPDDVSEKPGAGEQSQHNIQHHAHLSNHRASCKISAATRYATFQITCRCMRIWLESLVEHATCQNGAAILAHMHNLDVKLTGRLMPHEERFAFRALTDVI